MAAVISNLAVKDATAFSRQIAVVDASGTGVGPFTPIHALSDKTGTVIDLSNPMPTRGGSISITQTVVTVTTSSTQLVAANANRKYLAIQVINVNGVNLGFGATAVLNQGWAIDGAASQGAQGGAVVFEGNAIPTQAINAIAAANTTVVILEG